MSTQVAEYNAVQPTPPVVEAENLSVTFASASGTTVALQDVNISIDKGEFISLIGPSGCGKTTLLRVIADLQKVTKGIVRVGGLTPEQARIGRLYGYVFQQAALLPWRTIRDNVCLPLEIMGFAGKDRRELASRYLDSVGLAGFEERYPAQLSGGMQQRASIARALAFSPDLLLMDEPFGALDEITRDHLNLQLTKLWGETAKTCVFVTHSIAEAVFLSTRIVVMSPRPGRILDVIDCNLPRERTLDLRESSEFQAISARVRDGLRAGHSYDD